MRLVLTRTVIRLQKNIEYGLEHLSNGVVGEVTVAKSNSGGRFLRNAALSSSNKLYAAVATHNGETGVTFEGHDGSTDADAPAGSVSEGDLFRIHGNHGVSQVLSLRDKDAEKLTGFVVTEHFLYNNDEGNHTLGTRTVNNVLVLPDSLPIIDNGFKYRVSFDENAGDLPDLVCNTDGLRSVYRLSEAAYVSRDEPDRVYFVDTAAGSAQPAFSPLTQTDLSHPAALTAGDTIYVGEQRCDIVSTDSDLTARLATESSTAENIHTASVVCAMALKENAHSTADAIVTHDVVEVLLSGSTQTCASTDRPELRFAADSDTAAGASLCADATACARVLDYNGANRRVRWSGSADSLTHESGIPLMDTNDLTVGDRVSIRTLNDHTYETRTVDYMNFNGEAGDNYFTVSQPFTAAHKEARIHLNYKGTQSSQECSGRGLCDGSSADCQCFKGYTGVACEIQNALAA